jgi:hypothetical protein
MNVFCKARLNYAGGVGLGGEGVEVDILDGRSAALPGWRQCGFELVSRESAVVDWDDDRQIAEMHYAETEELAHRLTGCDLALVSDHVRRRAVPGGEGRAQSPVHLVHSDFAADYDQVVRTAYRDVKGRGAATLARTGARSEDIENASRLMMMQFWRNLGAPLMDYPVAFCDCRTVAPDEARPFRYNGYVAGGRSFDALAVERTDRTDEHRWYTFPEMTEDEVVAFRTFDTELVAAGATWFTPHTAFRDPSVEPGQPGRTSVELRVMCLFL